MRIVFFSEDLSEPFDEGIKKTANYVYKILTESYDVLTICRFCMKEERENIYQINRTNKLLINFELKKVIHKFKPNILIYLPSSSGTFPSFIRLKILSLYSQNTKTIMINLQQKYLKSWQVKILPFIKPDIILSPSQKVINYLRFLNSKKILLPLFIDLEKFKPLYNTDNKLKLREKYNIPRNKYVISHMGHLNWGRNLEALVPLQNKRNQVIVVGSSSTPIDAPKEEKLKNELIKKGIIVIDEYIPNIEEIYQLSDLYVFPVEFEGGSIGLPLSILEARACGIPVLTTDFGTIQQWFGKEEKGIYYAKSNEFLNSIEKIKKNHINYHKSEVGKIISLFNKFLKEAIEQ